MDDKNDDTSITSNPLFIIGMTLLSVFVLFFIYIIFKKMNAKNTKIKKNKRSLNKKKIFSVDNLYFIINYFMSK